MPNPKSLPELAGQGRTLHVLACLHGLLAHKSSPTLDRVLDSLAQAFDAGAAGLLLLPARTTVAAVNRTGNGETTAGRLPWDDPEVIQRAEQAHATREGPFLLATFGSGSSSWLLWLSRSQPLCAAEGKAANTRSEEKGEWTDEDAAALALAGPVLSRRLGPSTARPAWAQQMERAARQAHLETAIHVVRRLAHDYGNLCTGILGFSELALQQPVPPRTMQRYLRELHKSAEEGASLTQRLQQLARTHSATPGLCSPVAVLAEEEQRLCLLAGPGVTVRVELAVGLTALAIDAGPLRQVLAVILDNAREAVGATGSITVTAGTRALTAADCPDWYGNVQPGEYGEVLVTDSGPGLSPEARQRLFLEPFWSSRSRKRGFGLLTALGILQAHRGGLRLDQPPGGPLTVRFVVPRGAAPVSRVRSSSDASHRLSTEKAATSPPRPALATE
jgi:signal transduction histidine kinase